MENHKKCKKVGQRILVNNCEDSNMSPMRIKVSSADTGYPQKTVSDITILPTVHRFFFITTATLNLTNGATIPANLFSNDYGNTITEFSIFSPNGYVNLHVNGMIQEGGIYSVHANALTFIPQNAIISSGTPIIVESLGFKAIVN